MDNTQLQALRKQRQKLWNELIKKAHTQANLAFQDVFNKYPELENFGWTQYTPYFNDGEACEFGVHAYPESIILNEECCDGAEENSWKYSAGNDISEIVESFDEEELEQLYGEGRVVIHRDGTVETEEFDHD